MIKNKTLISETFIKKRHYHKNYFSTLALNIRNSSLRIGIDIVEQMKHKRIQE